MKITLYYAGQTSEKIYEYFDANIMPIIGDIITVDDKNDFLVKYREINFKNNEINLYGSYSDKGYFIS